MRRRLYHFFMPKEQADALIALGVALEPHTKRSSPLDKATLALDEQMAMQDRRWERCKNCGGTGWVEDE